MTIKEYAKKHNITREAVLYRIKKEYVKAYKNDTGAWVIEEEVSEGYHDTKDSDDLKIKLLSQEIEHLKKQLESKDEIIQAERRTNIALLSSLENQKSIEEHKPKKGFIAKLFNLKLP
jgi:hypothetical protein